MPLEITFCNIIVVCLLAVSILSAAVGVGLLLSILGVCFLVPFFITQVALFICVAFTGAVVFLFGISFPFDLFYLR